MTTCRRSQTSRKGPIPRNSWRLRDHGEPRLNLKIIQRYVLWRVFDLGWTTERFGGFDLVRYGAVCVIRTQKAGTRSAKNTNGSRCTRSLPLFRITISIGTATRAHYPFSEYHGPWQSYKRDIDPSLLRPASNWHQPLENDVSQYDFVGRTPVRFRLGRRCRRAQSWIDREDDLPDVGRLLQFRLATKTVPHGLSYSWIG